MHYSLRGSPKIKSRRAKNRIKPKNIKSNDIKEGWSEPKTYWYRAEIPEFTVVTIFGHLRREIQISKNLTYVLVCAEALNCV